MVVVKKNKGGGGNSSSSSSSSLTKDERRALRGSKFAPLPAHPPPSRPQPRLAHPGGPLATNKAAALAKFLERKLQQPGGLTSINPDLLELAVKNAKETVNASKGETSDSGRIVRHVATFGESPEDSREDIDEDQYIGVRKKLKKKKKDSGEDIDEDQYLAERKKLKKKRMKKVARNPGSSKAIKHKKSS